MTRTLQTEMTPNPAPSHLEVNLLHPLREAHNYTRVTDWGVQQDMVSSE